MIEIIQTDDGSKTIYSLDVEESYHSSFGAIQESEYIFIKNGFNYSKKNNITIVEVGFGTGLNAYLTLLEANKRNILVDYIAIEKYPLDIDVVKQLNFSNNYDCQQKFLSLHTSKWNEKTKITDIFHLIKIKEDFTLLFELKEFDVCYFDAFSPNKQPEMWDITRFEMLYKYAQKEAIITTYCAKGSVRRNMQSVGFIVERVPGPIGKREIIRAKKVE